MQHKEIQKEELTTAMRLRQWGVEGGGKRLYDVTAVGEKGFCIKNVETGLLCSESYDFLYLYEEVPFEVPQS